MPEFEDLLVEHLPHIRAFLRLRLGGDFRARESVSDLVQSVCLEALQRQERFSYQGDRAFRAWICNAALNKLRERRRYHLADKRDLRREAARQTTRPVLDALRQSLPGPVTQLMHGDDLDRIERAADLLPERQREVLTLFHIVGLSHAEIGELLDITPANSRQILTRAIAAFAVRWEELGREDS